MMHLPRRSVLAIAIALCSVWVSSSLAAALTPVPPSNPVADGFRARSVAFFDADHGIVTGTIVCHACAKRRTAAISTTADGGRTWSAPVTFGPAVAGEATVVLGGVDAWALIGQRLAHSGDGGTTWIDPPEYSASRIELRRRDVRVGDPPVPRFDERRLDIGRRGHVDAGSGSVPARSEGPAVRHPRDHPRRLTVCGGNPAAGSLLQAVWRTTDGGTSWTRRIARGRTRAGRIPLPRGRSRMALALQLRRSLPHDRRRSHMARPRSGRERLRRRRVVRLRHHRLLHAATGQRVVTPAVQHRRRSELVRRRAVPRHVAEGMSSSRRATTRRSISSRIGLTSSTLFPAGSGSSQSR